uniref:hypothetical protein n=1 Tax=uncultured Parasphingopyxis sp. TaxID=1547918 RepID=UPI0026065DE9
MKSAAPGGEDNELEVSLTAHTLHLTSRDQHTHWCFDRCGRLMSGHRGDRHHRVGLDASVLMRVGPPTKKRDYQRLDAAAADAFFDEVAADAARALALLTAANEEV